MRRCKRMLLALCAALLLTGVFAAALPGYAADAKLLYRLTASKEALGRGSTFTLDVWVAAEGAYRPSALRFYLLYDKACFTLLQAQTQRQDLLTDGLYGFRIADASETGKFPAGMSVAQKENYAAAVVQWASLPQGGALPAFEGPETQILQLTFQVNDAAPYAAPGGKIFLSNEYDYGDTPYLEDVPVDLTNAGVLVQPLPPEPVGQILPGGG
ncbi:MAG: hypothetical protein LBB50_01245, partial [Oscillospiraceae bacterium]|nr:hypothetical protein [Oscillospiraceae bacterium]